VNAASNNCLWFLPALATLLCLGLAACSAKTATNPAPPPVIQPGFAGLIGVAREDITPPVGIFSRNWGAATHDVAETIHRPFTATVLSIRSKPEEPPLLLAALDLGWWRTMDDEEFVRIPLIREIAHDPSRVIVNLSHTHAGPSTCRDDRTKPGGEYIEAYLTKVRDALLGAARKAVAAEVPATLEWRYGRCDLASNRDLPDPARERIVTGLNPSHPADDTLLVGRVSDAHGTIRATIVNYACHPTTLAWESKALSPDYPGEMRAIVESATGNAPCLFLQGNSGDLAPRDDYAGDPAVADRNGAILGYAALATLTSMLPAGTRLDYAGVVESGAPLATWSGRPQAPSTVLRVKAVDVEYELASLPSAAEIERQMAATDDRVMKERLLRKSRVRRIVGDRTTAKVPLWVWRVGDAYIVAQPNEPYSDLQRHLRRLARDRPVVSLNLANGGIGYLVPRELHALNIYQVWQSPFAAGSLERLMAAAGNTLQELAP
jgi:hypothetical protein